MMRLALAATLIVGCSRPAHRDDVVATAMVTAPAPCAVPELGLEDASAVTIGPGDFSTWTAMFAANPDAVDYLLTAGDYTPMGTMTIQSRNGVAGRKRTIRFKDKGYPETHPARRGNEALVDGIKVTASSHWIIYGLTQRNPIVTNGIDQGSSDIVMDSLLIEHPHIYGIRVRTVGGACITRSVIRYGAKVGSQDNVGVQIQPISGPSATVYVIANEIYDIVDGVQITDNAKDSWVATSAVIEGNDIYTSPDYSGCTENAIDLKGGSDTTQTVIRNNRMWGYVGANGTCGGSGSRGDAIVVQRAARNLLVEGNEIFGSRNGVVISYWVAGWPDQFAPRGVKFFDNYVHDNESAVDVMMDMEATGNTFALGQYLCDTGGASGVRAGGPIFRENTLVGIGAITYPGDAHPCPYAPEKNRVLAPMTVSQNIPRAWER